MDEIVYHVSRVSVHEADYKPDAWRQYTLAELGQWVHLLATRAEHRLNAEARAKDINDAEGYLAMMAMRLDEMK